jgi:uncharacterized damage-inducible protein DinB
MSSYSGREMAAAFRTVRANTIQVAEDIPEPGYTHVAAPDCRTVGGMFVHIALSGAMYQRGQESGRTSMVGFDFMPIIEEMRAAEAQSRSKAEILDLLRTQGDKFVAWLENVTPEFLGEEITQMDGKTTKTRFEILLGVKEHEMHHRAQLMLIERQLGIVPHLTRRSNERIAQMRAANAARS